MQPIAATLTRDGDPQAGQIRLQERLMRTEAEHRLANLLQFVSSNLERAARRANEPQVRTAMENAAEQVMSIGRLQRSLTPTALAAGEAAAARLRPLCASLEALLLSPAGHALTLEIDASAQDLLVPPDLGRCMALIVTELVINAAKHAFPDDVLGQVSVELLHKERHLACIVRDNGVGALPGRGSGLSQGMRIADTLATQAGGRCRWLFTRAGTEVEIRLPL